MDRGKPAFAFPSRDVGSYGNLGGQIAMGGGVYPLVDIELTDLSKPGWAISQPAHTFPTSLLLIEIDPLCSSIVGFDMKRRTYIIPKQSYAH